MTEMFTLDISSDGKTLQSVSEQDHSRMHALLNTPIRLDHKKTWYAKMSSIEVSKNVDTVICAPYVKRELSIRVGKMEQCPYTVNPNTKDKIPVTWIGESCVSFDFNTDLHTPTPSFTSANTVVDFLEYNANYNRVKLLNNVIAPRKTKRFVSIGIGEDVQPHKFVEYHFGMKYSFGPSFFPYFPVYGLKFKFDPPPQPKKVAVKPAIKEQDTDREIKKKVIEKHQPWSHVKEVTEIASRPHQYFTLTDVLEVMVTDGKLDIRVKADNPYGVNYAVIRAPTELSYIFGFPYEFSTNDSSPADPWYFAEGSKRWRIKACGVYGNTRPWDIWSDESLKIYHFSEMCNPLYEVDNVKVITDFTELSLTESKPIIDTIPLGAWISDPATKHYPMCIQSIQGHKWKRVITPGSSAISNLKLHLESVSGYPLRILGKRRATRITISFLPI